MTINPQQYHGALLQYVHNLAANERLNVGFVLYQKNGQLHTFLNTDCTRLKRTFPSMNSDQIEGLLKQMQTRWRDMEVEAEIPFTEVLQNLWQGEDSCLQWANHFMGVHPSPEKRAKQIFERYVMEETDE